MGSCFSSSSSSLSSSSKRSSARSSSLSSKFGKIVRVVHMNGSMEEYEDPITVGEVTIKQPKHFLFEQAQLLSLDSKPLDSQAQLQLGNIYFLLPHSVFKSEMSPMDLATISKRLSLVAAAQKSIKQSSSSSASPVRPGQNKKTNRFADRYVAQSYSPTSSPSSDGSRRVGPFYEYGYYNSNDIIMKQKGDQSPCSWKPILESITERSFTVRSDSSDLQDYR